MSPTRDPSRRHRARASAPRALPLLVLLAGPAAAGAQASIGLGITPYSDGTYRVDDRTPAGGAAARAGVRAGDLLTGVEIAGRAVRIPEGLAPALAAAHGGEPFVLRVRRGDRALALRDTLDARTAPAPAPAPAPAAPAAPSAGTFRVGARVEASLISGGVTFYPATILEVGAGERAGQYRVRIDGVAEPAWRSAPGEVHAAAPPRAADRTPPSARPAAPRAATPPAPVARLPRTLPAGEYQCFAAAASAFDSDVAGTYAGDYMGSFAVTGPTTYRFLTGTKLTGSFRYDGRTGEIAWLGGSLDGRRFRGRFRPAQDGGRAGITLRYEDAEGRVATQQCRKVR